MEICNYCGKFKKVREEKNVDIGGLKTYNLGTFICEESNKYFKYKWEVEKIKMKEEREKKVKKFVKERDKFLLEIQSKGGKN